MLPPGFRRRQERRIEVYLLVGLICIAMRGKDNLVAYTLSSCLASKVLNK